jgi:TIR domain
MAYAPGFEIDVFISYAHKNNETEWVTHFHEFLQQRVPEFLEHQAQVNVWRDLKLNGFDQLWPTLQHNIESSALLLSICSPVYVTSANCAKEVEHFVGSGRQTSRIDRRSRLARVAIIPYGGVRDALPCFRQNDTVYYSFFEEQTDGTIRQFDAGSEAFRKEADRVAQHVAGQLRRVREAEERAPSSQASAKRKTIFVANAARDRADHRTTLLNEFKDHEPLTILDGSYESGELAELTRTLLTQATCSVHLLGEKPGITVDDGDEPISHLQYRLALAHRPAGFTQVVWAPTSLQLQPGRQKEFVDSIRAFRPDVWNESTEVLSGTLDDLLRAVQGVLTRGDPIAKLQGAGPLYLLCTKADLDQDDGNLLKLRDSLFCAGVLPEFPAFDEQDVNLAELERTLIAQSCATLIYYGRGSDGWVKLKRQTLLRVLGDLKAQAQHVRALYVSTPANAQKQAQYLGLGTGAFTEAKGFPPLLVLGNTGSFEPDHLKALLERISQGESAA